MSTTRMHLVPEPPDRASGSQSKSAAKSASDGVFDLYFREDQEDRRSLRMSLAFAGVFHLVLLAITLPAMSGPEIAEPEKPRVIRLAPTPRWERPVEPVKPPETPRSKPIPMPDDTPHHEEPLVVETPDIEPRLEVDEPFIVLPEAPPEPAPTGPVRVGGKIERPERIHVVQPQYTEVARRVRLEGQVILEATIDESGRVVDVKPLRSLSFGLTESAIEAVSQWRYEPTTLNGKPVSVLMTVTVSFRLN